MDLLSRVGRRATKTNVYMDLLGSEEDSNRVLLCYTTSLTVDAPSLLMFPVAGKLLNVSNLSSASIMRLGDYFEAVTKNETMFSLPGNDGSQVEAYQSKRFQTLVVELGQNFCSKKSKDYYIDEHNLKAQTTSLFSMRAGEEIDGTGLNVVCAKADQSARVGVLVQFELTPLGKVFVPGTLHQDHLKKDEKYNKGDLRIFVKERLAAKIKGNIADYLEGYVKCETTGDGADRIPVCGCKTGPLRNYVILEPLQRKNLFYLGSKKTLLENLFTRVCEMIETDRPLKLGHVIDCNGGVMLTFNNFETKSNKSLVFW